MKKIFAMLTSLVFFESLAHAQGLEQTMSQLSDVVGGMSVSGGGMFSGFSWWSLIGGFIFSSIGMVAFIYGKKNSEPKPMIIGVVMMVYPYFLRDTIAVYIVGVLLTTALFFF